MLIGGLKRVILYHICAGEVLAGMNPFCEIEQGQTEGSEAGNLLSFREIQIVELASEGMTAKEIGAALNISSRTVQKHIDHISTKVHARNKTHLVAIAMSEGWIKRVAWSPDSFTL